MEVTVRRSMEGAQRGEASRTETGEHVFEFCFAASDPVFAGHFPGQPILPGVFQIEMTRLAAERVVGGRLTIREIIKAKFQRAILPDEIVQLVLKLSAENNTIHARAQLLVHGQAAGEVRLVLWRSE